MAKRSLKLVVCAAAGRMGSRVAALAAADPRFSVAALLLRADDLALHLPACDAVIDFSAPQASARFAAQAAAAKKAIVIGTTGFTPAQRASIGRSARRCPVFLAPNFSPGVAVLCAFAKQAARRLSGYETGIWELHHSRKRDAPSGTALKIARSVQDGGGKPPATVSQRLGDVVGEHTLTFAGPFERLELTHRAHSRNLFAQGALEAALWTAAKKPGLYGMEDLLGFK